MQIKNGTPLLTNSTLCRKCKWSTIIEGQRENEIIVRCEEVQQALTFIVVNCNKFDELNHPEKYELERQAWILNTNNKNKLGFEPPDKHR